MNPNNISPPIPTTTQNPIYVAFKDAGVSAPLVALMFCKAMVCLFGILLNANLVYITWKTKSLRGACNLQIALNALSICIQQSSSFVTFFVVVTGTNFIPLGYCGIIQALPLFCTIFTNGIAFSIGVDRLLSVLFPIWYMINDKRPYLGVIILICCIYASIVPAVGLKISLENPNIPVMCTVIDPPQKEATWVVIMLLTVNMASVCCYLIVWIRIKMKQNMKKSQVNIFKSLSVILLLEICGWITNYSMRLIVGAANIHALDTWYLVNISTIAPYLSMTLSPLVLYTFSSDYRRAFVGQIFCCFCKSSGTIYPSSTQGQSIQANAGNNILVSPPTAKNSLQKLRSSQSMNSLNPIEMPRRP